MAFWGQIQNYMMRGCLNILIVAMVKTNNTGTADIAKTEEGVGDQGLDWDELDRGLILSAFGYGYITTQIIGGRLAEIYGFKCVYGLGIGLTGVLTLFAPFVAMYSYWGFFALRVVMGICEGVSFPSLYALVSRWVPVEERSRFIARAFFGTNVGTLIMFPLCGLMSDWLGWESAFIIIGSLTIVWLICWCYFVFDTPEVHPRISGVEREFLTTSIRETTNLEESLPVPWKDIFTSPAFLSMACTDFCNCLGIYTFFTNGPTYLKFMFGYSMTANGFISAFPMLMRYIGGLCWSQLSDFLLVRQVFRVVTIRRIFNSISQVIPAVGLFILAYFPPDPALFIWLQGSIFFFNGALSSGKFKLMMSFIYIFLIYLYFKGHFASSVDLAPNFSGTVFGISNTFSGGATGFIVPTVIGMYSSASLNI